MSSSPRGLELALPGCDAQASDRCFRPRGPRRAPSSDVPPGNIFVGPSGWSYRSWRETVARGVPIKKRLTWVAQLFNAAEVNGSHYVQIRPETYAAWAAQTPDDFRFAVKGHRFVTHYKRLRGCADSIGRLRDQASGLGNKLAAVLWQLPAQLPLDLQRLDEFLRDLRRHWRTTSHVLEFRHRSWFIAGVESRLADAGVGSCLSDAPDFPLWEATPTDLVYVRLHGHTRKYASSYSTPSLRRWAARARDWAAAGRQVHVYLDNDAEGAAIKNAMALTRILTMGEESIMMPKCGPP